MNRWLGALLVCLMMALGACSNSARDASEDSSSPSAQPADQDRLTPTRPATPKAARCYRLRYRDALAPTSSRPEVPCRTKHTSVTFHVGQLKLRHQGREDPVDAARVQRKVASECPRLLVGYVGGSNEQLRLSVLGTVWFTPSLEDAELGASWFRCDVVAAGPDKSLTGLPGPKELRGILDDAERREAFALCGTAEPGTSQFQRVRCALRHTWKAVESVDLGTGAYPAADRIADLMAEACSEAAGEIAPDPLDYTWSEEAPTRAQWSQGVRHGLCWVPQT